MLKAIQVRISQGRQYLPDLRTATPRGFRGLPVLVGDPCPEACRACLEACPAEALALAPLRLDLGRCLLCGDCAPACPPARIEFTPEHRMASDSPGGLVVVEGAAAPPAVAVSRALTEAFGRSLRLRSVSSGGCGGCELELNALGNVNFDLGRHGIEFVASPRHADGLVLTGPLTGNMREALDLAWEAVPAPRFVVAVGACAISGGPYAGSSVLARGFLGREVPALYVPGCPPHPLTIISGILDLLGIDLPAPLSPPPAWAATPPAPAGEAAPRSGGT
ncbi:MAG: NADH:ubiquinone oxidoreductase [Anaeromyxobacter sp.]|nr:NADH:ubiquinone oxidoreductase [Anaeromyxobacter sp.]MBL0276239.1 NADH:ubiquinone oxidoreductase [Anaeromyxobacter sp.]